MEISIRLSDDDINRLAIAISKEIAGTIQLQKQPIEEKPHYDKNTAPQHLRAQVMDRKQIESEFSVGNAQLVKFRQAGLLTPVRFGLKYYYKRAEIEAILCESEQQAIHLQGTERDNGNTVSQQLRDRVMDRKQIEAVFSVGNAQLVRFRQAGLLTPVKFGRKYYYKRAEIEAILGINENKN